MKPKHKYLVIMHDYKTYPIKRKAMDLAHAEVIKDQYRDQGYFIEIAKV